MLIDLQHFDNDDYKTQLVHQMEERRKQRESEKKKKFDDDIKDELRVMRELEELNNKYKQEIGNNDQAKKEGSHTPTEDQ